MIIPHELWSMILNNLDAIDLHIILSVSKQWYRLAMFIIRKRLGVGKKIAVELDELTIKHHNAAMIYASRYNRFDIINKYISSRSKIFYTNVRFVNIDIIMVLLKQKKITLGKIFGNLPCDHPLVPKLLNLVNDDNLPGIMQNTPYSRHPNLCKYIRENFTDTKSNAMHDIWSVNLANIKKIISEDPSLCEFMENFAIQLNNANLAMILSTRRRQYAGHTSDASACISHSPPKIF